MLSEHNLKATPFIFNRDHATVNPNNVYQLHCNRDYLRELEKDGIHKHRNFDFLPEVSKKKCMVYLMIDIS